MFGINLRQIVERMYIVNGVLFLVEIVLHFTIMMFRDKRYRYISLKTSIIEQKEKENALNARILPKNIVG